MRWAACCIAVVGAAWSWLPGDCGAQSSSGGNRIEVARDRRSFSAPPENKPFHPRGFNYDHDEQGRLIEDYWDQEWPKIEEDFREMRELGANVVRVHLQTGKFLDAADKANEKSLARLEMLLRLAENHGLYLNLTGLGCYHKRDVPAWYDKLDESGRWQAQSVFWEAIAQRCAKSPAVFCYDLMNEPVVPGGKRIDGDWLGPPFAGKHFVQFITLDQRGRDRTDIAKAWIEKLAAAVRKHDRRRLITVGMVDWSLDRVGLTSGFDPKKVADRLDFISVHLYPERGKVDEALRTLAAFHVGKPVLIEETFPLKCSSAEFDEFLQGSRRHAAGWLGFYWGQTPDELRRSKSLGDALLRQSLESFTRDGRAPR